MVVVLALVLSAAFGAVDQYVGSQWISWGAELSSLSAPWLVLAFLAGATQRSPRRAALLGLACTYSALLGYFLLTDSPLEGAHYDLANTRGFFISNSVVVLGGIVSGPLFGWFGQQWRTRRALLGALVAAAAFCLEPLARRAPLGVVHYFGHGYVLTNPIDSRSVILAEVAAGLLLAAYFAVTAARARAS
jgi:hypothetical protein